MSKYVRARSDAPVLRHPESGALERPDPAVPVDASDPLVKAFPWAFVSDEDLAKELDEQRVAYRPNAIELARQADAAAKAREDAQAEEDADAVKMAKARADGKPQGDDAERDIASGETVESATAAPGEKRTAPRMGAVKKAR